MDSAFDPSISYSHDFQHYRHSIHQILITVDELEKQVNEVEQSTADIQVKISKGSSLVKDKGQEKHFTRTKKQRQDATHREAAAAYKMKELLSQSRTILDQLFEVDMCLTNIKEMLIQNCRKLSTEEKITLGTALTKLSEENLCRALEIVAESNPSFQATGQEVLLDIDSQSDYTLWRLKDFVKDALELQGTAAPVVINNCNNADNKNKSKRRKVIPLPKQP